MRIAIIGAGASGLYSAIILAKKHPDYEIVVFDKEEKIGRKLYATGNGHCNLLNKNLRKEDFNHPEFVSPLLRRYSYPTLKATLASWGVESEEEGDYVYPLSYNAGTYVSLLTKIAKAQRVRFVLGNRVVDYVATGKGYTLKLEQPMASLSLAFDALIFAVGGSSSPKLGSDGKSLPLFRAHGYNVIPSEPGLAPIKIVHPENVAGMVGFRHDAMVSLLSFDGKKLYEERGEVLFKEDGLSGIVIFNIESIYLHLLKPMGAKISLNFFPDENEKQLGLRLSDAQKKNPAFYLDAFFPEEIQEHFLKPSPTEGNRRDPKLLAHVMQNDLYEIKGVYGFENSQVTVGGVALQNLDAHLESTLEKGVYFTGEVVDIDGKCGGFNLSWALISALLVSEVL
jgi:predicted Rossmann fold flavoprotein